MTGQGVSLAERGREALQRRDPVGALALLQLAEVEAPSVQLFLDKALALRMLSRPGDALGALEAALVLEPAHFLALLSKGATLEQLGRSKEAARAYEAAIAVAPPKDKLPPPIAAALDTAGSVVASAAARLSAHLESATRAVRARYPHEDLSRFDESLEIYAGVRKPFVQQPLLFHFPQLPPIPFYDRSLFPWLQELEGGTEIIREERLALQETAIDDFAPYIDFPPGVPVNQWGELNRSQRWSSFFLWRGGERQDKACALCPRTAALLESLPMAQQPGYAPTAMFSVLDARTRIPPHTGSTNVRLVVHLPLVLPGPARFRVGNVTREWKMGEAWVFDDTIEHEAVNEADAPRTILIIDVWNPFLSEAERALVSAMMVARKAYEQTA
ncbi:MAG: aspartyl/asparaginyl beta-hydroxylase domain-containing protein [Caulobacteraceae bacterium]|nr:aspartyl/asparaginyl beta-hydroxylase domain-containing protein [Caulobacteraceae bacterium]